MAIRSDAWYSAFESTCNPITNKPPSTNQPAITTKYGYVGFNPLNRPMCLVRSRFGEPNLAKSGA